MQPIEDEITELLKHSKKRALSRRDIAERLNLHGSEHKQLTRVLNQLVRNGTLREKRGGYRLLVETQRTVEGTFALADKGYGFLRPDNIQQEDLFIPARHIGSAMDGDRVLTELRFSPRDRRSYAVVLRVLQRAHKRLTGFYQQHGKTGQVWPLDRKLGGPVLVGRQARISRGDVVEVEIEQFANDEQPARGKIIEVFGPADNPQVDIETVIRSHDLPRHFSAAALEQAESVTEVISAAELADRVDLRHLPLVTIDGETARDFDDAVALSKQADGSFKLWVSIADVSHYVEPQTPLDLDALERGTSVYFPGFCLPMLPESLSNGICSLNPDADRLVLTAELDFNPQGERLDARFYPAVIRSRARLTYTRVAACLEAPQQSDLPGELTNQLLEMAQLAEALGCRRMARGSLDLDLPEVEVLLDESGAPSSLAKSERTPAHRLIEEFMLAANEAVAGFLTEQGRPLLYRIHEQPDLLKLQELQQLAAECGLGLTLDGKLQRNLQQLLSAVADKPEAPLINQQLLRSLKQACYSPHNSGHFGLAADCYCHFTSPIRRYPDLVVHRALKQALTGQANTAAMSDKRLVRLGQDCSSKERRAMQAERDLVELRRCQIMSKRLGEEFSGTIASVTEFGFFVELDDLYVEGLVHIRTLKQDYYHFNPSTLTLTGERRRTEFRIGMRVKVKVEQVELWRRRIDFALTGLL